jgi:hypothetical protein
VRLANELGYDGDEAVGEDYAVGAALESRDGET